MKWVTVTKRMLPKLIYLPEEVTTAMMKRIPHIRGRERKIVA